MTTIYLLVMLNEHFMKTGIYSGHIIHQYYHPKQKQVKLPVHFWCLKLEELSSTFKNLKWASSNTMNLTWLKRNDHLGNPTIDLDTSVRQLLALKSNINIDGPIYILTQLRYFGHLFNPITYYYCFDKNHSLNVIVYEFNYMNANIQEIFFSAKPLLKRKHHKDILIFPKSRAISNQLNLEIEHQFITNIPGKKLMSSIRSSENQRYTFKSSVIAHFNEINQTLVSKLMLNYPKYIYQIRKRIRDA